MHLGSVTLVFNATKVRYNLDRLLRCVVKDETTRFIFIDTNVIADTTVNTSYSIWICICL